ADAFTRTLDPELEALRQFGRREANILYRKEIEDAGLELTDKGKRVLDDERRSASDVEVDAVRRETVEAFDRNLPAYKSPALPYGKEAPTLPSGKPRPAVSAKAMLDDLSNSASDPLVKTQAARVKERLLDDVNIYIVPK